MRYVMFILVTLALQTQVSMAKSEPAIGLAEGTPSAVNCPSGQYLAGFNVWSAPQISGFSPYCVAALRALIDEAVAQLAARF